MQGLILNIFIICNRSIPCRIRPTKLIVNYCQIHLHFQLKRYIRLINDIIM